VTGPRKPGAWEASALTWIEDIREVGFTTAHMHARAYRNRVAPHGIAALAGAAAALTAGDCLAALYDPAVEPNWTGRELLNFADDLARTLDDLGRRAARQIQAARANMTRAATDMARAIAAYRRAEYDLKYADHRSPAWLSARPRMDAAEAAAEAARKIAADCELALAELEGGIRRVAHAHSCALALPDDITHAYTEALEVLEAGGTMPTRGDWFDEPDPATTLLETVQ
jgi:hypothetical protein